MFRLSAGPGLEMRLLGLEHRGELFALIDANRAHLRRWLPWLDEHSSPAYTEAFLSEAGRDRTSKRAAVLGIWCGETLAGAISHHDIDWPNRTTFPWYWLAEDFQGRGVMTRCARVFLDHAFTDLGLNRVVIACATGNERSRRLAERLGFLREGTLREAEWLHDRYIDHAVYGLLSSDWLGVGAKNNR